MPQTQAHVPLKVQRKAENMNEWKCFLISLYKWVLWEIISRVTSTLGILSAAPAVLFSRAEDFIWLALLCLIVLGANLCSVSTSWYIKSNLSLTRQGLFAFLPFGVFSFLLKYTEVYKISQQNQNKLPATSVNFNKGSEKRRKQWIYFQQDFCCSYTTSNYYQSVFQW